MTVNIRSEKKLLGTLGAAAYAASFLENEDLLIVNGDTLFQCNLGSAYEEFSKNPISPLLIVQQTKENERYGGYKKIDGDEKLKRTNDRSSLISMGAVFTRRELLINTSKSAIKKGIVKPMMDSDFLEHADLRAFEISKRSKFIDIGIKESYIKAQTYIRGI